MTSSLKGRLQADLNDARRSRDKTRTLVLSMTLSEIRNREIDAGGELDDDGVIQAVTKAIKQRRDAAEQMRAGGREDLATKEEGEAELLAVYLPAGLSEDEVRAIIREIVAGGASAMGPVMGQLMPRLRGRFDGKEANRLVREELAG
ncbi:MAG: GatB/YqeY domain-containing protein [Gemmatimonadetes bacterium]|nr:GatB/YqeY domain-containing protein [Gemmatimonadota bacterium]NNF37363.1 GatB/YqeY domain-containing protein [Gemmatimonadota bacterium]NNK64604.1 GatB/YqeY domain-containing protein [Gemmatimonadota bacterium]